MVPGDNSHEQSRLHAYAKLGLQMQNTYFSNPWAILCDYIYIYLHAYYFLLLLKCKNKIVLNLFWGLTPVQDNSCFNWDSLPTANFNTSDLFY